MLNPDDPIAVTLTAAEWNQVMAVLAEGPFRVVAPLIGKIRDQAMAQQNGAGIVAPALSGNGESPADVSHR